MPFRLPLALQANGPGPTGPGGVPPLLEDPVVRAVSQWLRTSSRCWHELLESEPTAPGSAGSMKLELCVVLHEHGGTANLLLTVADRARAVMAAQQALTVRGGIPAGAALTLANVIVAAMAENNSTLMRGVHRALAALRGVGSEEGPPLHALVLRVSLRPLQHLAANDAVGTAWFRTTHANALVVLRGRVILMDPAAPSPLPGLVTALREALATQSDVLVLVHFADRWAPAAGLALCTLGAAVLALSAVVNEDFLLDDAAVTRLVQWVHDRHHWLLRTLVGAVVRRRAPPSGTPRSAHSVPVPVPAPHPHPHPHPSLSSPLTPFPPSQP